MPPDPSRLGEFCSILPPFHVSPPIPKHLLMPLYGDFEFLATRTHCIYTDSRTHYQNQLPWYTILAYHLLHYTCMLLHIYCISHSADFTPIGDQSWEYGSRNWALRPLIVVYLTHSVTVNMKSILMLLQEYVVSINVCQRLHACMYTCPQSWGLYKTYCLSPRKKG